MPARRRNIENSEQAVCPLSHIEIMKEPDEGSFFALEKSINQMIYHITVREEHPIMKLLQQRKWKGNYV
jgi:hypothetical protein